MPGRTSRSGLRSGCARSCRCVSMSRWLRPEPSRAPSTKPSVSSMNDGWPPAAEYRDHPPGEFGPDLGRPGAGTGMRLPRALAGKRVVDLSQFIAGPTAAMYLADFRADVIKVEA